MILNKHIIHGEKEKTVLYNFDVIEQENSIIISNLHFESPLGKKDFEDFEVDLTREEIDKFVVVKAFVIPEKDIEIDIVYPETAEGETEYIGLEGDVILTAYVPSDETQDITIDYKQVIDKEE